MDYEKEIQVKEKKTEEKRKCAGSLSQKQYY